MPAREVSLSGPTFERAVLLARLAVVDGALGGPGAEASLEPILTEAANDRMLGSALTFVLVAFASQAAIVAAGAELDLGGEADATNEAVAARAVQLITELTAVFDPGTPTG